MSAQHKPGPVFAFECRFADFPPRTINTLTRGKARYEYLLDIRDSYSDATFADISVRKIGPAHTSSAFIRTAQYRGMPDARCGDPVVVNGRSGFIVGHNDSANFDVLFVSGDWTGAVLNCHPGDIAKATGSAA